MYSLSINNLIEAFKRLPTVGQKTAERYVFYLLKSGKKEVAELTLALKSLIENVKSCEVCWNFNDSSPCPICQDKSRNQTLLCVVSESQDIPMIEKTKEYAGLYHVLRGVIIPEEIEMTKNLRIKELLLRIKKNGNKLKEIILAFNPDLAGETTMMYLQKEIKKINPGLKVSRLARGLPMGSDLQYADEITLGSALKNRI